MQNLSRWFFLFLSVVMASCAPEPKQPASSASPALTPVSFDHLRGWPQDQQTQALAAFRRSCAAWAKKPDASPIGVAGKKSAVAGGTAAAWKAVCAQAPEASADDDAARRFFESYFQPYAVTAGAAPGLFTGYYAPELPASLQRQGAFQTPLYARPDDLISVDLGLFKSDLKGQHIVGKVDGRALVLYDDRAAITGGSLDGRAQPLAWVDDPVSAFFLEVQGSGHLRLADGSTLPVGYDGANGRSYVAIGRIMKERGDVPQPVTMPSIRAWLQAHPEQARQVMNENPSYVFFRKLPDDQVVGAQGVGLTAGRSLAVDPSFIPLGAPLWLETTDGQGADLRRLMIAQDTGGAIKGPVRGDFFWGSGDEAAEQAGAMQSPGRYFILLPKTVTPGDE